LRIFVILCTYTFIVTRITNNKNESSTYVRLIDGRRAGARGFLPGKYMNELLVLAMKTEQQMLNLYIDCETVNYWSSEAAKEVCHFYAETIDHPKPTVILCVLHDLITASLAQ
jgi:hypothetical protein